MISIRRLVIAKQAKTKSDAFAYSDDIYRYIFARIGHAEEAEDMTMEVVHAVRKVPSDENLKPYMIGVARKKIVDHFRRKARSRTSAQVEGTYDLSNRDDFLRVQAVLALLAENYQEHLVLKYICGFSSEEVATMVESTATAVDNTLQRARKAFATEWNRLNGEDDE